MDAREERIMSLLERAVAAFETLASGKLVTASSTSESPSPMAATSMLTTSGASAPSAISNGCTHTPERAAATPSPPAPQQTEHISSTPAPALPLLPTLPAVADDEAIVVVPDEEDVPVVNCADDDPEQI